jgi:hypothetical protein
MSPTSHGKGVLVLEVEVEKQEVIQWPFPAVDDLGIVIGSVNWERMRDGWWPSSERVATDER